jgi:hypothetical protein
VTVIEQTQSRIDVPSRTTKRFMFSPCRPRKRSHGRQAYSAPDTEAQ